jgi:hypothetical protein
LIGFKSQQGCQIAFVGEYIACTVDQARQARPKDMA